MLLLVAAADAAAFPPVVHWPVELQSKVVAISKSYEGELALYVKDLQTGARYGYNSVTPMYLASTVKVAVLTEVFRQVDAGSVSLDEEFTVSEADLRDGSPVVTRAGVGVTYRLRDLIRLMMTESDNSATDLILGRIGVDKVNRTASEIAPGIGRITSMVDVRRHVYAGLDERAHELTAQQVLEVRNQKSHATRARLLSEMLGKEGRPWGARDLHDAWVAYYGSQLNSASMEAIGTLLEAIVTAKAVSEAASAQMLETMKLCKTGRKRLRGQLPPEVVIAHKTGTQYKRACNVGIVWPEPERTVVVAACVKGVSNLARSERVLSRVGRAIYDVIVAEPLAATTEPEDELLVDDGAREESPADAAASEPAVTPPPTAEPSSSAVPPHADTPIPVAP